MEATFSCIVLINGAYTPWAYPPFTPFKGVDPRLGRGSYPHGPTSFYPVVGECPQLDGGVYPVYEASIPR